MKRRVLSLLMTLCLVFTLLPVSAQAADAYTVTNGTDLYRLLEELGDPSARVEIQTDAETITITKDLDIPRKVMLNFYETDLVVADGVEVTVGGNVNVSNLQVNAGAKLTVAENGDVNCRENCRLFGAMNIQRDGYFFCSLTYNNSFEVYSTGSLVNLGTMSMPAEALDGRMDLRIVETGGSIDSSCGHIIWNYYLGNVSEISKSLAEIDERRALHPDWLQNAEFQFWNDITIDRNVTLPDYVTATFLMDTVINSGCTLTTNNVVNVEGPFTIKGTWVNNDHIWIAPSEWSDASLKLATGGKYSGGSIQVDVYNAPEEYTNLPWDALPGFKASMFEEIIDETEYGGGWYLLGEKPSGLWFESQPARTVTAKVGQTVKFTVVPRETAAHLSYRWQYKTPNGTWKDSSGTGNKTATLSVAVTASKNGYQYRCIVSDGTTRSYSTPSTLKIGSVAKPTITTQPKSQTVAAGGTATFTVAATGAASYQWRYRTANGTTWYNATATGNKSATLKVPVTASKDGYVYCCRVTNAAGTTVSQWATLTVKKEVTKPVITTQPKGVTTTVDGKATFTVKASGTGLKYQWQYRANANKAWANAAGTGNKTATMTFDPATISRAGYQYRCKITNDAGTVYTDVVKLSIKPSITTQPTSKTVEAGSSVTFKVEAAGRYLTYQWQYRAPGGSWKNNSCTSPTFTLANVSAGGLNRNGYQYRCVVTNGAGSATSTAATLTVK